MRSKVCTRINMPLTRIEQGCARIARFFELSNLRARYRGHDPAFFPQKLICGKNPCDPCAAKNDATKCSNDPCAILALILAKEHSGWWKYIAASTFHPCAQSRTCAVLGASEGTLPTPPVDAASALGAWQRISDRAVSGIRHSMHNPPVTGDTRWNPPPSTNSSAGGCSRRCRRLHTFAFFVAARRCV